MLKKIFLLAICIASAQYLAGQPACPSVNIGPDVFLNCNQTSVTINSNVVSTGYTNTYNVIAVPYAPPYAYNTGTLISVGTDDIWSGLITLPFNFCFYENNYSQIVVGSNGIISFQSSYAGVTCPWAFTASCPSASLPLNSIFGPYHDYYPTSVGNIRYALLGTYPCRTFVVNYDHIPEFSCTSLISTSQIVIYESTNIIEVYILDKALCSTWNSGNAIVGIQNSTGTVGLTAPGRNTGAWTAQNEAWRFTPNGTPNYVINWFANGVPIGNGNSITVSPSAATTYVAQAIYTNCNGNSVTVTDTAMVTPNMNFNMAVTPTNATICQGDTVSMTASGTTATYTWTPSAGLNTTTGPTVIATPTTSVNYVVSGTNGACTGTDTVHITVNPIPEIQAIGSTICYGDTGSINVVSTVNNTHFIWSPGGDTTSTVSVNPNATTLYTVYGDAQGCKDTTTTTVIVNPLPFITINSPSICLGENAILTASGATTFVWDDGSTFNPYTVSPFQTTTYSVTATDANNCSDTTSTVVTVNPSPTVTANGTIICSGDTAILTVSGATSYIWNTAATTDPLVVMPVTTTTYSVTGYNSFGCTGTDTATAIVFPTPVIDFIANPWATEVESPIVFTGSSDVPISIWAWDFGDATTDNSGAVVTHPYLSDGTYVVTLTATTDHPCVSSISHSVIIELTMQFPNVFSPNSDGINDNFEIIGLKPDKENKLQVFNRWGKKIYEKERYDNSWTGEGAADGTYYYIFSWKSYTQGKELSYSNTVTIIR